MDKEKMITSFKDERPTATGVFGYGSGVFLQANQRDTQNKMIDVIFVVEDVVEWHRENIANNPKDYSFLGKLHICCTSRSKLKGKNNIVYLSHINFMNLQFKYGVIEVNDFLRGLETWNNIFVAGRFQKPVLEIATTDRMDETINYNRRSAFIVACILSNELTTKFELYCKICGLSYLGDARMGIAEDPKKVWNIVDGSFNQLSELYPVEQDFIRVYGEALWIDKKKLLEHIFELPEDLKAYLIREHTNLDDINELKQKITSYLIFKNSQESVAQIKEGLKSNGVVKSAHYTMAKVKKRFQ